MKASLLASAVKKFLFESDDGAPGCQHTKFHQQVLREPLEFLVFYFIFPSAGRHEKVRPN